MPVIPVETQVRGSPQAGGELRAAASPGAFAAPGQALAQAGGAAAATATQFADRYAEANRQKQAADLSYDGMQQLSAIEDKWSRVPNSRQAIDGFNQESQQIRDQVLNQTGDPEVQAYVLRELNQHAIFSQNTVANRSFGLESSQQRATVDQHLDGRAQMAATATDPLTRASIVDGGIAEIKGSVAAGWMYGEQGEDRIERFRNQVYGTALRQGLQTDPRQTLAELDAGHYAGRLSPQALATLGPEIDTARAQLDAHMRYLRAGGSVGSGGLVPGGAAIVSPDAVSQAATAHGIDPALANATADIESAHGANLGVRGNIFQLGPAERASVGAADLGNPSAQLDYGAAFLADKQHELGAALGRDPTNAEVYLAHQQGTEGAVGLLAHPEARAGDVVGDAAIRDNGGDPNAPAGSFTAMWHDRYSQAEAKYRPGAIGGPITSIAAETAPPAIGDAVADIQRRVDGGEPGMTQAVADKEIAYLRSRYTSNQQATAAARFQLRQTLKDGTAMLAAGRDWTPPTAQINSLLPAPEADQANRQIADARDLGQAKAAVQFASPDELNALAARTQARLDQPEGFEQNQRGAAQIQQAIRQRVSDLADDPAAYVAQSPAVAAARADALQAREGHDPSDYSGATQRLVAASLAEQQRLGVPAEQQRVLTKPQAGAAVQQIVKADPATTDVAAQLDTLSQGYGRYWNAAFGDLVKAGLPAEYQVLAAMDHPEQAAAAGDMQRMLGLAAQKGGVQALKEATDPDQVKAIDQGLSETMAPFRATVRDPKTFTVWNDAVRNLATYYVYRGQDGTTALQNAYQGVIGARYDFGGGDGDTWGALRAPAGKRGTVEQAAERIQNSITPDQLGPVPGNPQLTPAQRQDIYADAIARGFWATNEGDDGAVLMLRLRDGGMYPARKADGSRIEFKFADAPGILAVRPLPTGWMLLPSPRVGEGQGPMVSGEGMPIPTPPPLSLPGVDDIFPGLLPSGRHQGPPRPGRGFGTLLPGPNRGIPQRPGRGFGTLFPPGRSEPEAP